MKKLKVALVLLFALTCSLFLFACGGKSDATFSSIEVTGAKTAFTEADTAFTTGDLVVTAKFKSDDPEKQTRVLTADEYEIDASTVETAFDLLAAKKYGDARGTYTVTVSATIDGTTKSATYSVVIDHAWNEDSTECSVCGATQETYSTNDAIVFDSWGTAATYDSTGETKNLGSIASGEKYVSYGSIGTGQKITLTGKGMETKGNTSTTYYFPITGIRNGAKGVVVRNDNWIIYDGPGSTFQWPNHSAGADATTGVPSNMTTAGEWDIYQEGTTCTTDDWVSECDLEISWEYREDGVIVFSIANLTAGKTITRYMNVPTAVYDCVLYGEYFSCTITQVTYTYNLTLEKFEMTSQPTKKVYAENTYLEINEDSSLDGVVTTAYYNQETSNVKVAITTYDIFGVIGEGENAKTVDLRENPVTADMNRFYISFGGFTHDLEITVDKSPVTGATYNYSFVYNNVEFYADDAVYTYDVNSKDKAAILVTGKANYLSPAQQTALGSEYTGYDYYIAFRIITRSYDDLEVATAIQGAVVCGVDGAGVNVVLPLKSNALPSELSIGLTYNENVTSTVYVEIDTGIIADVGSYIASNAATIDAGGVVTVQYHVDDIVGKKLFIGNIAYSKTVDLLVAENATATSGSVSATASYDTATKLLTVAYTLPALDVTKTNATMTWLVGLCGSSISTTYASETIGYNYTMSENAEANGYYLLAANVYLKVSGETLSIVSLEKDSALSGASASVVLNVQNETGAAYDLSFKATAGGIALSGINILANSASAAVLAQGTVGNNADRDVGAVYSVTVNVKNTLGIREGNATAVYYIEVVGSKGSNGEDYLIYKVTETDALQEVSSQVDPTKDEQKGEEGDCVYAAVSYLYNETLDFNYGNTTVVSDFAHSWVVSEDGTYSECSVCGSIHYHKYTSDATPISAIENATKRGITVAFTIENETSDWASVVATSDNIAVCLTNLDAYWQTEAGGVAVNFPSTSNAYPNGGESTYTLYNGVTWEWFLNGPWYVTITISPDTGITYYRDGVKMVNYPANGVLNDGSSIGDFIDYLLTAVEKGTAVFNKAALASMKNVSIYTAALSEQLVYVDYLNNSQIVVNGGIYQASNVLPVTDFTNLDESGDWWNGTTTSVAIPAGDFILVYTWTNTRDVNWYQDCVIELNTTIYLDLNFMCGGTAWGDLVNAQNHTTVWTKNGVALEGNPVQPATNGDYEGEYTVIIIRSGTTLTIVQTLVNTKGDVYQAIDVFTNFTTEALSSQLVGNPYWVDDFTATLGTVAYVGAAEDEKEEVEDNTDEDTSDEEAAE